MKELEMKFNLKVILLGGVAFYVTQFIVSMITGPFIHEGVLLEPYMANASFWRPELNQVPPDMAALLPRWITTGLITTFIFTAIFDNIRSVLDGSGPVKGIKFGFICWLFSVSFSAGWSGIFNLPNEIWVWWNLEFLVIYLVSGAVLGLVTAKLSPA
jgi:hypothetical protein